MKRVLFLTLSIMILLPLVSCDIGNLHTHAYGEWETIKEATCTEDGQRARSCSCGESEKEVISAKGHTEEVLAEKPATCTESGLTEGKKCSVCGEVLVKQETVAALGHDFYYHEQTDDNGNTVTVVVCQRENCGEVKDNTAGLYDADNKLLASWDELVNDYRLKFDHDDLKLGTKVIIDDSVTNISGTFENCASLTDIYISKSVIRINPYTFFGCTSLNNIEVDKDNEHFKSIDGNLYTKDGTILVQYAVGKEDKEFTIPDGLERIGSFAFAYSSSIAKIIMPESIVYIGPYPFYNCKSVIDIYYTGTSEEWEKVDYFENWWPNNIVVHYEEKVEFVATTFIEDPSSSTGYYVKKVKIYDDIIYFNEQLYSVTFKKDFEIEIDDTLYSWAAFWKDEEKELLAVLDRIKACENVYLLERTTDDGHIQKIVVCYVNNAYYFLELSQSEQGENERVTYIYESAIGKKS